MFPFKIRLCSQIGAFLDVIREATQRKQTGVEAETLCGERESKLEVSILFLPSELTEAGERSRGMIVREPEGLTHTRRVWPTKSAKQGSQAHRDSSGKFGACMGLHQVLFVNDVAVSSVFFETPDCRSSCLSWFFCLLSKLFSSCWVALSSYSVRPFALPCVFCFVMFGL